MNKEHVKGRTDESKKIKEVSGRAGGDADKGNVNKGSGKGPSKAGDQKEHPKKGH
jgi:hypothetical protein